MPAEVERRDAIDMRRLIATSDGTFDRMWLDVISADHTAAIQLAEMEGRGGRNAAARRLVRQIIAAQAARARRIQRAHGPPGRVTVADGLGEAARR